jgi:hypothetical protein
MTYNTGLAWKNISSMIIKNCLPKCLTATGDSIKHKEEFLGFPEKDVAEASIILDNILQVNNLRTWICDETPTVYKDDEKTAAEVLNSGKEKYLLDFDGKNEEMCELEIPKIRKVLDSISEVMNCNERQNDWDHLHLLHLQNIKIYMTKKCHQLLHQKKILDYFKNTD